DAGHAQMTDTTGGRLERPTGRGAHLLSHLLQRLPHGLAVGPSGFVTDQREPAKSHLLGEEDEGTVCSPWTTGGRRDLPAPQSAGLPSLVVGGVACVPPVFWCICLTNRISLF